MAMNSLYECSVSHCRLEPKRNAFDYRVFMLSVDVDEIPRLGRNFLGFSHNRFNLFSINDADHVDMGFEGGIRPNITAWLAEQGIACSEDVAIRLVTFPRVFGYGFNPVSFYYLSTSEGRPLLAVAEVVNTFREMKLYAVSVEDPEGGWHQRMAKDFYVSPFSDPGDEFDFKLGLPAARWRVNIDNYSGDERTLLSAVRGDERPLTSGRLLWYTLKYPLLSVKIITLIHWHAMLLWFKKVPFLRKSERLDAQLDVMRSHSSLNKKHP